MRSYMARAKINDTTCDFLNRISQFTSWHRSNDVSPRQPPWAPSWEPPPPAWSLQPPRFVLGWPARSLKRRPCYPSSSPLDWRRLSERRRGAWHGLGPAAVPKTWLRRGVAWRPSSPSSTILRRPATRNRAISVDRGDGRRVRSWDGVQRKTSNKHFIQLVKGQRANIHSC